MAQWPDEASDLAVEKLEVDYPDPSILAITNFFRTRYESPERRYTQQENERRSSEAERHERDYDGDRQ